MIKKEVVEYLKDNFQSHSIDDLRAQLISEGVSEVDFDDSLKAAQKPTGKPGLSRNAKLSLAIVALALIGAALFLNQGSPPTTTPDQLPSHALEQPKSVFLGHYGYVIHLPQGYTYLDTFKDPQKTVELVHFCKVGTDTTDLSDPGLFGELGIVRLQVQASPLAQEINGADSLAQLMTSRLHQDGQEFTLKKLQISSLRGFQINYLPPSPHVEAYLLGQKYLYFFTAGQDDEVFRAILTSLRDANDEG